MSHQNKFKTISSQRILVFHIKEKLNNIDNHNKGLSNQFLSARDCLNNATVKATSTKKQSSMKYFLQK